MVLDFEGRRCKVRGLSPFLKPKTAQDVAQRFVTLSVSRWRRAILRRSASRLRGART
jgi:hypothetical protein